MGVQGSLGAVLTPRSGPGTQLLYRSLAPAPSLYFASCSRNFSTKDFSMFMVGCAGPSGNPSFVSQVVNKHCSTWVLGQGLRVGEQDSPAPTLAERKLGDFEKVMGCVCVPRAGPLIPKLKTGAWKFQIRLRDLAQGLPEEWPPGLPPS